MKILAAIFIISNSYLFYLKCDFVLLSLSVLVICTTKLYSHSNEPDICEVQRGL